MGVSMNRSTSANATIWSNLRWTSRRVMPMMEPFRKMSSRPVRSGWKPAPISMREPRRALATNGAVRGTVTASPHLLARLDGAAEKARREATHLVLEGGDLPAAAEPVSLGDAGEL